MGENSQVECACFVEGEWILERIHRHIFNVRVAKYTNGWEWKMVPQKRNLFGRISSKEPHLDPHLNTPFLFHLPTVDINIENQKFTLMSEFASQYGPFFLKKFCPNNESQEEQAIAKNKSKSNKTFFPIKLENKTHTDC